MVLQRTGHEVLDKAAWQIWDDPVLFMKSLLPPGLTDVNRVQSADVLLKRDFYLLADPCHR